VKKKFSATIKDKTDWINYTKSLVGVYDKESSIIDKKPQSINIPKIDLHGISLEAANKIVKNFLQKSIKEGYKKVIIITGKGSRSKIYNNPYKSEKLNTLRYAVPDFIKNDSHLCNKINKISAADLKDGGEGALYIYLKKEKKL
tara:strand:+ start:576 stop:1007 length:432 start_codon:yes stop_codon:yes gene_type:complete